MHNSTPIVTRGAAAPAAAVRPSCWSGQTDCDVGPFCCREVANRFAAPPIDFGQLETLVLRVERRAGSWYVRVSDRGSRPSVGTRALPCSAYAARSGGGGRR